MGGATTVLLRAATLAAVLGILVAYSAGAGDAPSLPSEHLDVVFYALVALPAFAAAIWLALPLAHGGTPPLVLMAASAGVLAVVLALLDVESGANIAKLACYTLAGFAFLTLFEELWWIALVAVLVPWVDIWSVAARPDRVRRGGAPGLFERVAVAFPSPGERAIVNIGPPDILFFALFLAAADRFGLRVGATWIGMSACLAVTLVLVWSWDEVAGLPALPAVWLGFLLPNADLLWRDVRRAASAAYARQAESRARTRRAACAGTCPPACSARARSRTRRGAPAGPRRASSGCTRRRRSAARRARRFAAVPCPARPARGGSTMTTSGLARFLAQLLDRLADVAREEARVPDPVSSAFSIAHATDSSEISSPQTVRASRRARGRSCRSRSTGRRRSRALSPAYSSASSYSRSAICGVRLQERRRADAEAQPEDLLLDRLLAPEELRRQVRLLRRGVVDRPVDRPHLREPAQDVDEVPALEALARGRSRAHQHLAGVPALAHHEVAEIPGARRLVVRLELLLARPLANREPDRVAEVGREEALLDPDHLVPAAGAMEAEVDAVLARS